MSELITLSRVDTAKIAQNRKIPHDAAWILSTLFKGKTLVTMQRAYFTNFVNNEVVDDEWVEAGAEVEVLSTSNAGFNGIQIFVKLPSGKTAHIEESAIAFRR